MTDQGRAFTGQTRITGPGRRTGDDGLQARQGDDEHIDDRQAYDAYCGERFVARGVGTMNGKLRPLAVETKFPPAPFSRSPDQNDRTLGKFLDAARERATGVTNGDTLR
jgi:hypothetical protein